MGPSSAALWRQDSCRASLLLHDFDIDLLHVNLLTELCREFGRLEQLGIHARRHGEGYNFLNEVKSIERSNKLLQVLYLLAIILIQCRAIKVLSLRYKLNGRAEILRYE